MIAVIMAEFHQAYSEIMKMPLSLVLYLYNLAEEKNRYITDKIEDKKKELAQNMAKLKSSIRR